MRGIRDGPPVGPCMVEWLTIQVDRYLVALNIKNKETYNLAQQLAELTGENMTQAITEALRERLDRIRQPRSGLADRLLQIGRDCASHLKEPFRSIDHGDLLYDEKGLPR